MAGTAAVTRPDMHIANTVGAPGRHERVIQQRGCRAGRDMHLARAGGDADRDAHGTCQPKPRSNCAVSNSGSPTTPE